LLGPDVRSPIEHQVFEQVSKTRPPRGLVLRAYVIPDLNIDHGRLVVFHKANLEAVWKGQGSNSRLREGDGFANPREKEQSRREDGRAQFVWLMENSRQLAPNLEGFSLPSVDFIIEPHKEVT
jgi:hypothetical protein